VSDAFDPDCLFCRIVVREIPGDIVHESDAILAFRDIQPKAPTHILLIPKEHLASVADVGEHHADVLAEIMRGATHLADAEGIQGSGWRLVTNVGPDAGQSVAHLHFHLLGGRRMAWPPG
jgi:histidine triad (HIT) family protein